MGKATKKKKEKAADFTKTKLKLGKGKQVASNAIDTSFKARSIALPSQSITEQKSDDVRTTKRKLSLDNLITHLKHYNATTRKDAVLGMKELLGDYPELIELHLAMIINACVRAIADEDAQVRKSLLGFFSWLFPHIPSDIITPHSSTLLLFTSSAQTHIFPEIRIDATRFLTLFLMYIPETMVSGWCQGNDTHGSRILEGYLGLISAGTKFGDVEGPVRATSTASVMLTPASKLIVLQSLSQFLQHALPASSSLSPAQASSSTSDLNPSLLELPIWYLRSSFRSQDVYEAFFSILRAAKGSGRQWQANADDMDDDFVRHYPLKDEDIQFSLADVMDACDSFSNIESSNSNGPFLTKLVRALYPILQSTFLDCAPAAFSPSASPPDTELQLNLAVVYITRNLYNALLQDPSDDTNRQDVLNSLTTLLGHMAAYFPFTPSGKREIKVDLAFQEMNIMYCELCSLLDLVSRSPPAARRKPLKRQRKIVAQPHQATNNILMEHVASYTARLLRGEAADTNTLGRPLTSAAYASLLPTIWSLLNLGTTSADTDDLFKILVEHCMRTSSRSAVKKFAIEFIARLVLLPTEAEYHGRFRITEVYTDILEEWILHLPKVLWELSAQNLSTTMIILRFFHRALQRNCPLFSAQVITGLQSRLIPFFSTEHPTRGLLMGPFSKLSPTLESNFPLVANVPRLALDAVFLLLSSASKTETSNGLIYAIDRAVGDGAESLYWFDLKLLLISK